MFQISLPARILAHCCCHRLLFVQVKWIQIQSMLREPNTDEGNGKMSWEKKILRATVDLLRQHVNQNEMITMMDGVRWKIGKCWSWRVKCALQQLVVSDIIEYYEIIILPNSKKNLIFNFPLLRLTWAHITLIILWNFNVEFLGPGHIFMLNKYLVFTSFSFKPLNEFRIQVAENFNRI